MEPFSLSSPRRWFKSLPIPLLRNVLFLLTLGVLFIYSASFRNADGFAPRQLTWILVSAFCFFLTVRAGYRFFLGISYPLYALAMAGLILVFIVGEIHLGARRWIEIGSFSFQPSEFAKLAIVLALSNFLGSRNPWEGEGRMIGLAALMIGIPLIFIVKQPDLGSAMLLIPAGVVLLFLWGIRYRYLVFTFLGGLLISPLAWNFFKDYQKKRILVFLNPNLDPLGSG